MNQRPASRGRQPSTDQVETVPAFAQAVLVLLNDALEFGQLVLAPDHGHASDAVDVMQLESEDHLEFFLLGSAGLEQRGHVVRKGCLDDRQDALIL